MSRLFGVCLALLFVLGAIVWLRSGNPPRSGEQEARNVSEEPKQSSPSKTAHGAKKSAAIEWANAPISEARLRSSIHRSADYLTRHCLADGRFVYLTHTDSLARIPASYNMLRHLGAMYSLGMYQEKFPKKQVLEALLRAENFFRKNALGPVGEPGDMLAVWSRPAVVPSVRTLQAKLGGTGLALIALCQLNDVRPGAVDHETLTRLARFLVFMQKENGEFFCKYIPSEGGKSDRFVSQYYPGEAALGLMMLYAVDADPKWLNAAAKAMVFLARTAPTDKKTIPDHWLLLAYGRLVPNLKVLDKSIDAALIRRHVHRTLADMISDQFAALNDRQISGSYTPDGRSCPTATRLEGMLASLNHIPLHQRRMRDAVRESTRKGMEFLLSCQVTDGKLAGGFTCFSPKLSKNSPHIRPASRRQMGEIRIDYVQHSLSCMLQFLDRCGDEIK